MPEFLTRIWELLNKPVLLNKLELPFSPLELLLKAVLPIAGMIVLYRLIRWFQEKMLKKSGAGEKTAKVSRRNVRIVLRISMLGIIAGCIGALFGARLFHYINQFFSVLNDPFFVSGKTSVSLITLILLIPVFYFASWAGKGIKKLLDRTLFEKLNVDEARKFSIGSLTRYLVMIFVFIIGLAMIGIDLSAIGVLLGVLGIGIGFGLQGIVSNFFAGLVIISTRPIKEQDRVLINNIEGTVKQIRMISTNVLTLQNENIIIPNSEIIGRPVHNYTYEDRRIIIINTVQVSYGSDLEQVLRILTETSLKCPHVIQNPPPEARVLSFDSSGITVELRSWIEDVIHRPFALSMINLEIWRAFKTERIVIPFPQMDVHLDRG